MQQKDVSVLIKELQGNSGKSTKLSVCLAQAGNGINMLNADFRTNMVAIIELDSNTILFFYWFRSLECSYTGVPP